jgi:uncharacterized paraquat-inducible protein A
MRLIDADRLNKEIKDRFGYSSATAFVRNMQDLSQVEVFKHIMKLIEVAPTLEKRQPGEWLEDSGVIACSHCHTIWLYRKTNYCPNCGAKMKGTDND